MTVQGWLSTALAEDEAVLRHENVSADPVIVSEIPEVPSVLDATATAWARHARDKYWSLELRTRFFGNLTPPTDVGFDALKTAFLNAAAAAGMASERLHPRQRGITERAVVKRLDGMLREHGLVPLLRVFLAIRAREHGTALAFYRELDEDVFADCRRHLPSHPQWGRPDLLYGIASGFLEVAAFADRVIVRMTADGEALNQVLQDQFTSAGLIEDRAQLLQAIRWQEHGSEFGSLVHRLAPTQAGIRTAFVRFANLSVGGRVADVGSGAGGGLVGPGELADAVAPTGDVTAIDPVGYLLETLREAARQRRVHHVRTLVGTAEHLPLAASSLDAVTSQAALHFFSLAAFVSEAWRVLKPGGVIALAFPIRGTQGQFFAEVLEAMRGVVPPNTVTAAMPLADPERVMEELRRRGFENLMRQDHVVEMDFGYPGDVRRFLLDTVRFLQYGLANLPLEEQRRRQDSLQDRIEEISNRFPISERTATWPVCMIRADKPGSITPVERSVGHDVAVVEGRWQVFADGKRLPVSPSAGHLLYVLMRTQLPLSEGALAERLGGLHRQTVYAGIAQLRAQLPAGLGIRNIRGQGYVLVRDANRIKP